MKRIFLLTSLAGALLSSHAEIGNVAPNGTAYTTASLWAPGNWNISKLNDTDRGGVFHLDVAPDAGAAYSLDLGKAYSISQIKIYPRQDGCCPERLRQIRVSIHNADAQGNLGAEVWGTDLFTDGSNAGSGPGMVVLVNPPSAQTGRWVQIKSLANPVPDYSLQMTELEVFAEIPPSDVNRALNTAATANRMLYGNFTAAQLTDGNRFNVIHGTNTQEAGFAYFINLGTTINLNKIVIWARQDACCPERLSNYEVSVHKDNAGQIGDVVWKADLHTDGTNPGSDPGSKDELTAALNPTGQFKGQWIRIQSLDNPVPDYALQIGEVEAFGTVEGTASLQITKQPADTAVGVGQTASFSVTAGAPGGDPAKITYQWQKEGVDIVGATNATYTTPPLLIADDGKKFRAVVSYPGLPNQTSDAATVRLNLAFQTKAYSNRPLWAPGGWNISKLVNGDRNDVFHGDTDIAPGMAYQVDLGSSVKMQEIVIYPRQDGCCPERLQNFRVSIHKDDNGKIGASVWSADLFTDGSNAGSGPGTKVSIKSDLNAAGKFEGQWIQILSLEDPEPNYAMQMSELEVYGTYSNGNPVLQITGQPADYGTVPGRTAKFNVVAKVVNGDPSKVAYQWQKNGVNIAGANASNLITAPLAESDTGAKFSTIVSYPGAASVVSSNAVVSFDNNYAKGQPAFSNRPLWGPGKWDISTIVDGNRGNLVHGDVNPGAGFAYTINLGADVNIDEIDIYPRQDGCCPERLANFRVSVHKDNAGQIGDPVWSADLFTDGTNAGSGPGTVVNIKKDANPTGTFHGQWVKIMALDDPVPDYFLQIAEVEVIGKATLPVAGPAIVLKRQGSNLTLSWTGNGFVLESTDALPSSLWQAVTGVVNNSIAVSTATGRKFYRLRQP